MGVFHGFTCDKCKKKFIKGDPKYCPSTVQVAISFGNEGPNSFSSERDHQVWCRECLMATGICKPVTKEDKIVSPEVELTFEEKFSMLLEDLGFTKE